MPKKNLLSIQLEMKKIRNKKLEK